MQEFIDPVLLCRNVMDNALAIPGQMPQLSELIIREDFLESLNFWAFQEIISNNNSILIKGGIIPVSYTHLDVYKRQEHFTNS